LAYTMEDVITVYKGANYGGDTPEPVDCIICPVCKKNTEI